MEQSGLLPQTFKINRERKAFRALNGQRLELGISITLGILVVKVIAKAQLNESGPRFEIGPLRQARSRILYWQYRNWLPVTNRD